VIYYLSSPVFLKEIDISQALHHQQEIRSYPGKTNCSDRHYFYFDGTHTGQGNLDVSIILLNEILIFYPNGTNGFNAYQNHTDRCP